MFRTKTFGFALIVRANKEDKRIIQKKCYKEVPPQWYYLLYGKERSWNKQS